MHQSERDRMVGLFASAEERVERLDRWSIGLSCAFFLTTPVFIWRLMRLSPGDDGLPVALTFLFAFVTVFIVTAVLRRKVDADKKYMKELELRLESEAPGIDDGQPHETRFDPDRIVC